jgi:DNA-binding NtrC family response regulator
MDLRAGVARQVLVAHADQPMRHLIEATLRHAGHAVEACTDIPGLVVGLMRADAVVADGRLGGFRPDDVAELCSTVAPDVPCVLVCGAREDAARMQRHDGGRLHVLIAPFGPADIVRAVSGVLDAVRAIA